MREGECCRSLESKTSIGGRRERERMTGVFRWDSPHGDYGDVAISHSLLLNS